MNTTSGTRALRGSPLLAILFTVAFAGTSLATDASGFTPTGLSRGTIDVPASINTGTVEFETEGSVDVVTATVTLDAPASSGWHSHPGLVLVTVLSGSVTMYDAACAATVHSAGTSFVESGDMPGVVLNESTETPAVVYVTYIVPTETPKEGLRIDAANPGCPQA
jgi:quercetin dioxygenase-like cupin family protein